MELDNQFTRYYYYNTNRRNASLSVCTCGMEHRMGSYRWGPGKMPNAYYDICHVIKGKEVYVLDGVSYPLRAGDTFVAYPRQSQLVQSVEDSEWHYIWVGMNGDEVAMLLQQMNFSKNRPVIHTGVNQHVIALHRKMHDCRGNTLHETLSMTGYLYLIFAEFIAAGNNHKNAAPDMLERALEYIQAHYHEALLVDDVCRAVNVSRSWLYRSFMKYVGLSPIDYIIQQRLIRSCYYLTNTKMPIYEVAEKCGFSDALYYSRLFRRVAGISPTQYRNSDSPLITPGEGMLADTRPNKQ